MYLSQSLRNQEAHSEPCRASKIERNRFANRANNHSLFFTKRSDILDTWQGSEFGYF